MNMKQSFSNMHNLVGFGNGDSQKTSVISFVVENSAVLYFAAKKIVNK